MSNLFSLTEEHWENINHLRDWLQDNCDMGHSAESQEGIHFDNEGEVYSPQVLEALDQLLSLVGELQAAPHP